MSSVLGRNRPNTTIFLNLNPSIALVGSCYERIKDDINLGFEPIQPPEILYHGTATRFVDNIMESGLEKRARHHVHLSADKSTAANVGQRHGKLIILEVRAMEMFEKGFQFFKSENGVWLTDKVPTFYLNKLILLILS